MDRTDIKHTIVRQGQQRAYQDSVYEYEISCPQEISDEEVKKYCVGTLRRVNPENEKKGYNHNGCCGFEYGLESFFTFSKLSPGKYKYTVTSPYTG